MAEDFSVEIQWDQVQLDRFVSNPQGDLGRVLSALIATAVVARAKMLALKRTGRMASEIHAEDVRGDSTGLYVDVVSPAVNPQTGFPYPVTHEAAKTRDRRPHRSLVPALNEVNRVI